MNTFQEKFVEEAFELIDLLENSLLKLEEKPNDKQLIGEIFRVMHSLKGSGAMFGFEKISSFTHKLEDIYDLVRNQEMELSEKLFNLTLRSVDHLRELLDLDKAEQEDIVERYYKFCGEVEEIARNHENKPLPTENSNSNDDTPQNPENKKEDKTFQICFKPKTEIFINGTNPLYLLDELNTLGECEIIFSTDKIPVYSDFNPEFCYVKWDVTLKTSHDRNAISDVFIFVDGDSFLEIEELPGMELLESNDSELNENGNPFEMDFPSKKKAIIKLDDEDEDEKASLEDTVEKIQKTQLIEPSISSIRVASKKIDELMNLVNEMVTIQARLTMYANNSKQSDLISIAENFQKLSRQLRDNAFNISLIPIENIIIRYKRLIRDLSGSLHKKVDFRTEGTETEIDKTIIEQLSEPLMHIFRNCIDHGIEDEKIRIKSGKPATGLITFKAFYSGSNVHIIIEDDGAGIDTGKIKQKAIDKSILSVDYQATEKELFNLLFLPGFSTSSEITDVSGRGVGMDVVRKKINNLRGDIEIKSELGKGTTITIILPLTLSIIDGLLVEVDNTSYIIPLSVVDKIFETDNSIIQNSYNNIVVLDGQQIPFYDLRKEFNLPDSKDKNSFVVTVRYENQQIGIVVDKVQGETQAVLKSLGRIFLSNEIISGATILGDGLIALVLDTNMIIKSFSKKEIKNMNLVNNKSEDND